MRNLTRMTAPTTTPDAKAAHATAVEIAAALVAEHGTDHVEITDDPEACTTTVVLIWGDAEYQLPVPATGTYPLYRDGAWVGGMRLPVGTHPTTVAHRMTRRVFGDQACQQELISNLLDI